MEATLATRHKQTVKIRNRTLRSIKRVTISWQRGKYMKISFLSPTYNSAQWIETMLDSIPKEYAYEIIVCDDASTDQTLQICQEYQKHCPQLKIIRNESNLGASESYNRLIQEATGDYVAIIDSDDKYLPEIRDVLAQIDGDYDIYYYNMITREGRLISKLPTDGYLWPGQFKIIRRSFIGDAKFSTRRDFAGDWDFNRALVDKKPHCKYTEIIAYWYNYPRPNSESDLHVRRLK